MSAERRLGSVAQHVVAQPAAAEAAEDSLQHDGGEPRTVFTTPQQMQEYFKGVAEGTMPVNPRLGGAGGGNPGNNPRHSEGYQPGQGQSALQGYGILGSHPAPFDTADAQQFDAALEFYHQNGVRSAFSASELSET